jgi:hypothetical protein
LGYFVWKITILRQKILFFPIFLLISWILLSDIAYYRTVVTYTKRVNSFLVQVKYDFTKGGSSCQKCIYRTINVMETAYSILKKRYITNGSLYAYYNVHIRCRIRDLSSLLSVNSVCILIFPMEIWNQTCTVFSILEFIIFRTYVRYVKFTLEYDRHAHDNTINECHVPSKKRRLKIHIDYIIYLLLQI